MNYETELDIEEYFETSELLDDFCSYYEENEEEFTESEEEELAEDMADGCTTIGLNLGLLNSTGSVASSSNLNCGGYPINYCTLL